MRIRRGKGKKFKQLRPSTEATITWTKRKLEETLPPEAYVENAAIIAEGKKMILLELLEFLKGKNEDSIY